MPTRRCAAVAAISTLLAMGAVLAACGSASTSSPTQRLAATYDEFVAANCAAAQALFGGYGNPDTAALAPPMQDLDDAITRGDAADATLKAAVVKATFVGGRAQAAVAAGWAPAGAAMMHLDRMLAGMIAMVDAEIAAIGQGPVKARESGQRAFEAASGPEDWQGWLQGLGGALKTVGKTDLPDCDGVPW
jgi:hypothetical protein